jgi:energy-coupling factor transporter ATP-binding protein EcfA2
MSKPYDTRLIMMVAQEPFQFEENRFCKLIPIVYVDGTRARASDFPNDGEVWWMLTGRTEHLAEPGRLVAAVVEDAVRHDRNDPASSFYQVSRDTVQDLHPKDGMDIVELDHDAVDSIEDVVSDSFRIERPFRPTQAVMLRWQSHLYGPFTTSLDADVGAFGSRSIAVKPTSSDDMTICEWDQIDSDNTAAGHCLVVSENVSQTPRRRSETSPLTTVRRTLLLSPGCEKMLAGNPKRLVLQAVDRRLMHYAKQLMTRAKRQQLRQLLEELELTGQEAEDVGDLGRIRRTSDRLDAALDSAARALLESGFLGEDRVARAEMALGEKYVQERTAELQAKIEEQLATKREELRRVDADLQGIRAKLDQEEIKSRTRMDEELASKVAKIEAELKRDREEMERRKGELVRQESVLQKNLENVTKRLRESGDDVVNQFLTIAPLLGVLGLGRERAEQVDPSGQVGKSEEDAPAAFEMPPYATGARAGVDAPLSEQEFFDRFCQVVADSGFSYPQADLQRFHVSVKCGELTVLAGPSGTGKSSLPALYSRALLGSEAGGERPGCLMVNVNPSWIDSRDLLGHMNTLDGRFYPAESGLFQHLICAQEEYKAKGSATGVYTVCMDEMNLSQIEHYFSDFMMVLEREESTRVVQCFSREVAGSRCPFRAWGYVSLSPALRFIGTVNVDETTRLLSDRFLDRVNYIDLTPPALPAIAGPAGRLATAGGRMVVLADLEAWRTDSALPAELGSLLDQIRPQLNAMSCPISPRVYRAICRFVSSAGPVMTAAKAFDAQVAQRILPRVRGLVTRRQMEALDTLLRLLGQSSACSFELSLPLLQLAREAAATRSSVLEE